MSNMNESTIRSLLEKAPELKTFTIAFHELLADANKKRDVSKNRTKAEKQTDALGRLLRGDEVCAAVAIDGEQILISSNKNNHSDETLVVELKKIIIKAGSTSTTLKLVLGFEFITKTKKFERETDPLTYHRSSNSPIATFHPLVENIAFTFPYTGNNNAHEIHEYPYPITLRSSLEIIPTTLIDVGGIISQDILLTEQLAYKYEFFLDPLRRRADALFNHLGLFAAYHLTDSQDYDVDFEKINDKHRIRVVMQTLGWEAPEWVNLDKELREYDYIENKTLPKKIRKQKEEAWKKRKVSLQEFHDFIASITDDLQCFLKNRISLSNIILIKMNDRLKKNSPERTLNIQILIREWIRLKLLQLSDSSLPCLPDRLQDKNKAKIFFERAQQYFEDIFLLEKFIVEQAKTNQDIAKVIASIKINQLIEKYPDSKNKILQKSPFLKPNAKIVLVGDQLPDKVHTELRLFHYLATQGKLKKGETIPYFGITMLCCPNCHLYLKSHGIDYVEGKRLRSGLHAQHYPDWILPKDLTTEEHLKIFFGTLYEQYASLVDEISHDGKTQTNKEWVLDIICDLGKLQPATLQALGFTKPQIWPSSQQGDSWYTLRATSRDEIENTETLAEFPEIPSEPAGSSASPS